MPRYGDRGKALLSHVRKRVNECYYREDAFRKMYLEEPDGCVPEDLIGDDLLSDIKNKYYWPVDAVRDQLEREFGRDPPMWIYVDPSYEDSTWALLTLDNRHILLTHCQKPWQFWFESEAEMRKELLEWYRSAQRRYRQVTAQSGRGRRE